MTEEFTFTLRSVPLDENYRPAQNTRVTTNFANLARGADRKENLRKTLRMIDNRFNALADWDNQDADRYSVRLEILSVDMEVTPGKADIAFPLIEILKIVVVDRKTGQMIDGIAGNNFSSYVRDYDFSVFLPAYNKGRSGFNIPDDFGTLHGSLFKQFVNSDIYRAHIKKAPVICLSASSSRVYLRTENRHPVLGVEYLQDERSLTDLYFAKMGLQVHFFMPRGSVAPLAFYCGGDLLADYTNLELIGTIATMETFQKIYRPEIYNANAAAGRRFQPSLQNTDYSMTQIVYDREERSRLAIEQGQFADTHFIQPHKAALQRWSATCAL